MKATAQTFDLAENNDTSYQPVDQGLVDAFPKVYIFSVAPEPHIVSKGGLGEFLIPGANGKRVSSPLVIKGRHPEHMHLGGPVAPVNYVDGKILAQDIVGILSADKGLGRHTSNLEWHGVFISENEKPSEREISAAEAKRVEYLQRLVADADQKAMRGQIGSIDAEERKAAHELNLKKSWAEKPSAMDTCPACGTAVGQNIAVCPQCTAVLNEDLARKFFPGRFPAVTEPAKKA